MNAIAPLPAVRKRSGSLRDVLPIAENASWWRNFLAGVALERPVSAAWRDEAAELERLS